METIKLNGIEYNLVPVDSEESVKKEPE